MYRDTVVARCDFDDEGDTKTIRDRGRDSSARRRAASGSAAKPPPPPPPRPTPQTPASPASGAKARSAPPKPPPKKLPAFLPAETVVPMVQYRGADRGRDSGIRPAARSEAPPPAPAAVPAARAPAPEPTRAHPSPPHDRSIEPAVIARMLARPRAVTPEPVRRGQVVVVFGCRGGAGSTTLAVNTAAQLVRAGRTVCVVDLDVQLGDVFVALDLEPHGSLAQIAQSGDALDDAALRRRLAHHRSGVYALTQVGHLDELDGSLADRLPALFGTLTAHFDYVVVDGVRDFGDAALAALDAADQIVLVVTQDVPAVRRAARALTLLRRLGYADERFRLVMNRARSAATIDEASIERALGTAITARIRDDARVTEALDEGALLGEIARARGVATDIADLADMIRSGDRRAAAPPRRRRRLFGLLGRP